MAAGAGTIEFLRTILPSQGHYVLAVQRPGRQGLQHKAYATVEELAEGALRFDQQGCSVYHCCATVSDPRGVWNEKKGRHQIRVKANAEAVGAQWLDLDVGEGKEYATRKEALTRLAELCKRFKLPKPLIVSSGRGLHCYWPFKRPLEATKFTQYARHFSEAIKLWGFRHDTKPTRNVVTLLRPVGSHHRKGEPRPVKLVQPAADPLEPAEFYKRFGSLPRVIDEAAVMDEWGSGTEREFAPSSAKQIVKKCRALYDFATHKPDEPTLHEELWRNLLGLLKHTVEGEKLAHRWSKASDDRYNRDQTQEKLDNWLGGPPKCETIAAVCESCAECPYRKKITSPISLGESPDLPPPTKEAPSPGQEAPKDDKSANATIISDDVGKDLVRRLTKHHSILPGNRGKNLPFWNPLYSWDGNWLQKWVPDDDDGGAWVPFSQTLYYPFIRYETDTDTRAMMVCALIDAQNNKWRIFELNTKLVADQRTLAAALAEHEVVYMKKHQPLHQQFVQDILQGLRSSGLETRTYSAFGWGRRQRLCAGRRAHPRQGRSARLSEQARPVRAAGPVRDERLPRGLGERRGRGSTTAPAPRPTSFSYAWRLRQCWCTCASLICGTGFRAPQLASPAAVSQRSAWSAALCSGIRRRCLCRPTPRARP
jgi:hypothetical protein